MSSMAVHIVSLEGEVFSGEANVINAPAHGGEVGIHPGHAPLLSLIRPGEIKIQIKGQEDMRFFVIGGILEVQPDLVTVLADTIERSEDLDKDRAEAAKKQAEAQAKDQNLSAKDMVKVMEQLEVAVARLRMIEELQKKH